MRWHARSMVPILVVAGLAIGASPAAAFWQGLGTGSGIGTAASMPAAAQPSGTASAQSVTLSWPQSSFLGGPLGSFTGGGYTVTRYASGSSTAITPNAACATRIGGTATTLQCVEAGVAYGSWQYTITPVLNTFTGATSAKSLAVVVTTAAPVLSAVTAQNPSTGQTTGDIRVSWATVSGATGFNVYRRIGSGAYGSPLNGGTPLSSGTTTYADPGSGLAPATSYGYVVSAVAGSPTVESPVSGPLSATTITRPAAPSGAVTATAAAAASVNVGWASVSGVAGYNVYRRTFGGSYDFGAPLNGATPLASATYTDTTAINAMTYLYRVRSVLIGAGGAQVESANSAESASATADGVPPPTPTNLVITGTGPVIGSASCLVAAGTRFVNASGTSVTITATIATPEAGESVIFSASTTGSPVTATVAATTVTVSTSMDLSSLMDGTVVVTARTMDAAGNLSATLAPANVIVIVKDVVAPAIPTAKYYAGVLGILAAHIDGMSECGAAISAQRTTGGTVYTTTAGMNGSYVDALGLLAAGTYYVTATDLAGNTSLPATT